MTLQQIMTVINLAQNIIINIYCHTGETFYGCENARCSLLIFEQHDSYSKKKSTNFKSV